MRRSLGLSLAALVLIALTACTAPATHSTAADRRVTSKVHQTPTPTPTPSSTAWMSGLTAAQRTFVGELTTKVGYDAGDDPENALKFGAAYCAAVTKSTNPTNEALIAVPTANTWTGLTDLGALAQADLCPKVHRKTTPLIATTKLNRTFLAAVEKQVDLSAAAQHEAIDFGWDICEYENGQDDDAAAAISDSDDDLSPAHLNDAAEQEIAYDAPLLLCPHGETSPPPLHSYYQIKVFGNGSESNDITWMVDEDQHQYTDVAIPWTQHVPSSASYFSVLAQDDDGTSITCEILDDNDKVLKKNTAVGPYAIATCQTGTP